MLSTLQWKFELPFYLYRLDTAESRGLTPEAVQRPEAWTCYEVRL